MRINKYHLQVLIVEAIAVVLVALGIFVIAWVQTFSQGSRARDFLSDFTKLQVGTSTFEDAKSVAVKHGGIPWWVSDGSMRCTYQGCVFRFVFENKPLTSTHLVPYGGLIGMLTVKNGVVVGLSIDYVRYAKRSFAYDVIEIPLPPPETPEGRGVRGMIGLTRFKVDSEGVPLAVRVVLEPSSPPDQRKRAYALNLSCLSRIFGCSRAESIFPPIIPYRGAAGHFEKW